MPDDILRLRATVVSEEALANLRAIGREIGFIGQRGAPGIKVANVEMARLHATTKLLGTEMKGFSVAALGVFGIGGGIAASVVGFTRVMREATDKVVELKFASKELGLSTRQLQGYTTAAEKVGISSEAMTQALYKFKDVTDGLKYNIGGTRDELISLGATPVIQRVMAARTQAEKLAEVIKYGEALFKEDPSGLKRRKFYELWGLGAEAGRLSLENLNREVEKAHGLTEQQLADAVKARDLLIDLGKEYDKFKTSVAIGLAPGLTNFMEQTNKLVDWLGQKNEERKKIIEEGFKPGGGGPAPQTFLPPGQQRPLTGNLAEQLAGGYRPISFGGGGAGRAGGGLSEFSRAIKDGVFAALVDFKSYMEGGAAAAAGGMMAASFGGSAGAAAGGGIGRLPGAAGFGGGGYSNLTPGTGGGSAGGAGAGQVPSALDKTMPDWAQRGGGPPGTALPSGGGAGGGGDTSGAAVGTGAFDRSRFAEEIKQNPELAARLQTIVQGEVGHGASQARKLVQLETIFNRAAARGQSLAQVTRMYTGQGSAGYYPPATFSGGRIKNDAEYAKFQKDIMTPVLGGSDESTRLLGFPATGNASGGVAARGSVPGGRYTRHGMLGPETYVQEGRWGFGGRGAREDIGRLEATRRIDGAIDNNATGGTNVNGNVAVNITSNGTAARATANSDGFWQKTTIQNYKQMQPTEAPTFAERFSGDR
jgi:hypothetical protein